MGNWKEYFVPGSDLLAEWSEWIKKEVDGTGIEINYGGGQNDLENV